MISIIMLIYARTHLCPYTKMLISIIIDRTHFIRGHKHFIDLSIMMLRLSSWERKSFAKSD